MALSILLDSTSISARMGSETTTYRGWNLSKVDFRQVSIDVVLNAVAYTIFILDEDEKEVFAFRLDEVTNQPYWTNDYRGATAAVAAITPIIGIPEPGGGGGTVDSVVPGIGIDVDATDPANPIVSQADTAVTPGTYAYPSSIDVDQQGNVIAIVAGTAPGGGDVIGPASSIPDSLPLFADTSGKLLKQGPELSLGGSVSADDGKVPIFGTEGQLTASSDGANPALTGIGTGSGASVYAEANGTGPAILAQSNSNTTAISATTDSAAEPAVIISQIDAAGDALVVDLNSSEIFAIGPGGEWRVGLSAGMSGDVLTSFGPGGLPAWQTPTTGDVVGPASATDGHIAQFDGTTGKLIKDGLATSTGGNGATDSGKVLLFGAQGQLQASSSTANAIEGIATSGTGVYGENNDGTAPAAEFINLSGPIAHFHNITAQGMVVENDGGVDWTSGTGAQTTADNLPVFGALTQGVVPAAGAVPAATNFLDETGAWSAVDVSGVTGTLPIANGGTGGTTVATALAALGIAKMTGAPTFNNSTTAFTDVTGATITIPAGVTAQITMWIVTRSANAASGINVSITATNSPTIALTRAQNSAAGTTQNQSNITANDGGTTLTTVTDVGSDLPCRILGTITTGGSASVIQLRLSRGGASASNVTVQSFGMMAEWV
jgi:hypothetical protein